MNIASSPIGIPMNVVPGYVFGNSYRNFVNCFFLGNLSWQMTSGQHNDALLASISARFCSSQTGFPSINARQYIPVPPPAMLAQYFKAKGTISLFDSSRVMEP